MCVQMVNTWFNIACKLSFESGFPDFGYPLLTGDERLKRTDKYEQQNKDRWLRSTKGIKTVFIQKAMVS